MEDVRVMIHLFNTKFATDMCDLARSNIGVDNANLQWVSYSSDMTDIQIVDCLALVFDQRIPTTDNFLFSHVPVVCCQMCKNSHIAHV